MEQPSLFDLNATPPAPKPAATAPADQSARDFAVDPSHFVVLEASAGTGKTRVLVERYVRLLTSGVDPRHILAITFTRKAAAEMRERVVAELRRRAAMGGITPEEWRDLRDRVADIEISTIDAFCYGLLREFPLEADVDPAFEIADETEMGRFANEALDLTLRAVRGLVTSDESVRLLLARVKPPVLRDAVSSLLDRRHIILPALATVVHRRATCPSAAQASAKFIERLRGFVRRSPDRAVLLDQGPVRHPEFRWLREDLAGLDTFPAGDPVRTQQLRRRIERYFLTKDGEPRKQIPRTFTNEFFESPAHKKKHQEAVASWAPVLYDELVALDADVTGLLARGLQRVCAIAASQYERLLDEHALLDFAGMLERAVALLERQEEFARSRLKLQSRYHHVLVDEFQDTSRAQWRLIELLIDAWGEGEGAADAPTSIFVVGDRKQSIYRFRHAEATLLDEATRKIGGLRPGRPVRQAITHSFRAVPELLGFVNALSTSVQSGSDLPERFQYADTDRFPVGALAPGALRDGEPVLGVTLEESMEELASGVATEIARLLATATVRDRQGPPRAARPDDIAILFRARAGHQFFEEALEVRGVRTYVYKGLGFFDAPEIQDVQALLRYLAEPESDLRAAELLRSRLVRLSDDALAAMAPHFARALRRTDERVADRSAVRPATGVQLDQALLDRARQDVANWLQLADRVTPSELIDRVLSESAYFYELRGRRLSQARENLKKVRALIRRVESRGYTTLGRLADYFETLRAGEESHAVVAASGCVSLMTIHAAKGLEFPIIFIVNMQTPGRGKLNGFSIIERSVDDEPEVAFESTPGTRLEERREEEELRRLLYVAVTRARDRLYFASELDPRARPKRGARTLAGLLPPGLLDALAAGEMSGADVATWETPGGGGFTFRICRPGPIVPAVTTEVVAEAAPVDRAPLTLAADAALVSSAAVVGTPAFREWVSGGSTRLLGTLVHRLFQRRVDPAIGAERIAALVAGLVRAEELVDVGDPAALSAEAATAFLALRRHPEVVALLETGRAEYEVPFTFTSPDRPGERIRGAIDCVVTGADGNVTILEFKTGGRRPEHEAQAALYADAMRTAMPDREVAVKILYSGREA